MKRRCRLFNLDRPGAGTTAAGAKLLFPPTHSPDINPIEQVFPKLKHLLRKTASRSFDTLTAAVGQLFETLTPQECANYCETSGYAQT